jgi:aromatic ring-opening dioxygenase catalytic subunit (LigB family)
MTSNISLPSILTKATRGLSPLSKKSYKTSPSTLMPPNTTTMTRTPVYFISHGGPNLHEDTSHPAYSTLQTLGQEITHKVHPKAIVVISAHWQSEPKAIEVNTAESIPLVYDYYGFPDHYYELQYPHTGSPELANKILGLLGKAGIKAEGVRRGLDHGVFIPFLVAFDPVKNPLNVPIVQVSLFASDSGEQHLELGRALAPLRDEGVLVIGGGMSVHNLRDFRMARMGMKNLGPDGTMPYVHSFEEALREAVESAPGKERDAAMGRLLESKDARRAHPSFEHLLPVYVAAGAAGEDKGVRVWTMGEGSLGWGMYRFGEV